MVAYHTNPLLVVTASHMGTSSSPSCSTFDIASYYGLEKQQRIAQRHLKEARGSQLQISPALTTATIWGVNRQMECLFVSSSL